MSAARFHVEQDAPNGCVPACAAMVLARGGRSVTPATLAVDWSGSRRGYPLARAAEALGWTSRCWDVTPPAIELVRSYLREGQWMIVQVFAAPLADAVGQRPDPPRSRFGALPDWPGALHALVLVEAADDGSAFRYLDPYFPAVGQPYRMTAEELARCWQGGVVFRDA